MKVTSYYRPWRPLRENRIIAILFFLNLGTLDGVGGQHHAPAAFTPGKTRYQLYRRLVGPLSRSGRVRKISPPPGFDPRTFQPVASCYTDYTISTPEFVHINQINYSTISIVRGSFELPKPRTTMITTININIYLYIFFEISIRCCCWTLKCILKSYKSAQEHTKLYSNFWKIRVHTELSPSAEFCTHHKNQFHYSTSARMKRNLE